MATVRVRHSIGDLVDDCRNVAIRANVEGAKVVRRNAEQGNALAKSFASQQHTMNSDIDEPYHRSFSAEQLRPMVWEYGPVDDGIKHGGRQAKGYENGSRNQRPHLNLDRSVDVVRVKFSDGVSDMLDGLFW